MAGCSSKIGAPKTNKYVFGAAEVRVGAIGQANKLKHEDSLGVMSDVTLSYTREFTELRGGPGNAVLSRGATGTDAKITATLSEYTHRNLMLMVGNGLPAVSKSHSTTANAVAAVGDTSITIAADGTGVNAIAANDILSIHSVANPQDIQIVQVDSIAGTAVTLKANTPIMYDVAVLDVVTIQNAVGGGANCGEKYLTVQVVAESSNGGAPTVLNGWYGSVTSGLEFSQNNQNFSETPLEISLYPVPSNLTSAGAAMEHVVDLVSAAPTFQMYSDV